MRWRCGGRCAAGRRTARRSRGSRRRRRAPRRATARRAASRRGGSGRGVRAVATSLRMAARVQRCSSSACGRASSCQVSSRCWPSREQVVGGGACANAASASASRPAVGGDEPAPRGAAATSASASAQPVSWSSANASRPRMWGCPRARAARRRSQVPKIGESRCAERSCVTLQPYLLESVASESCHSDRIAVLLQGRPHPRERNASPRFGISDSHFAEAPLTSRSRPA